MAATNLTKTLKIGDTSYDIGAAYDGDGNEIANKYVTVDTPQSISARKTFTVRPIIDGICSATDTSTVNVALFDYSTADGSIITSTGNFRAFGDDDSTSSKKPTDKSGFNDLDTYYFNTGIALYNADTERQYQLSFPGANGTLVVAPNATTGTATGSATQPVYISSSGTATACTYSLNKTVPSSAVFTDTNVTQAYAVTNASYPVLFSGTSGITSELSRGAITSKLCNKFYVNPSTGSLYSIYFYATSDERLKENIVDADVDYSDIINKIKLREFSWKSDEEHKPVLGAIAQEMREAIPEKYRHEFIGGAETEDEYLSISDEKLVYIAIGALKEQKSRIDRLEEEIAELKAAVRLLAAK